MRAGRAVGGAASLRCFGQAGDGVMGSNQGIADRPQGLVPVLVVALAGGIAFSLAVSGDGLWEPPPASSFVIEQAFVEAERPPLALDDELPAAAVLLTKTPSPQPDRPERLALGETDSSLARSIGGQAIPTSASGDEPSPVALEEGREDGPEAASEADVGSLLPTPRTPTAPQSRGDDGTTAPQPDEALRSLVTRIRTAEADRGRPADLPAPQQPTSLPAAPPAAAAAPLPGTEWTDPDGSNWSEPPPAESRSPTPARGGRLFGRFGERLGETRANAAGTGPPIGGRILERVRDRLNPPRDGDGEARSPPDESASAPHGWPLPATLVEQLSRITDGGTSPPAVWAAAALADLDEIVSTAGPDDAAAEAALLSLGDRVGEGMSIADAVAQPALASQVRRAALAVARRVAVWRAAASCCAETRAPVGGEPAPGDVPPPPEATAVCQEIGGLLRAVEQFEESREAEAATAVRDALRSARSSTSAARHGLERAIQDHYLSPNVRIAVHEQFAERLLPESTVTSGPLQDFVLGRKVRGTKTVEQSTGVRFLPHPAEIRLDLLVTGEIASRTVTEAGSVAIHSTAQSSFTVHKPITVSTRGLAFGPARGSASNQSRLAGIETGFDAVPLMGPIVRGIARNQHDVSLDEASREVNAKIVGRACSEVDQQTEPRLTEVASGIRDRFWSPMVGLGLEPTAVALETTAGVATARLRLAADSQLAAHTPRPRAPEDALFSMQVHESSVNNACGRFGLSGRKMSLEELTRSICTQLGLPPTIPDDLPQGVDVTFAAVDPLRVECRDGLVHVRVALDALESGRRSNWYDIVAHVAYRPTINGMQVALEREGPVQLSGPGHKGRMEFGLRTIFGKMFPKERPVKLVPEKLLANPRMRGVQAVQAVVADGWLGVALGKAASAESSRPSATARNESAPSRVQRR